MVRVLSGCGWREESIPASGGHTPVWLLALRVPSIAVDEFHTFKPIRHKFLRVLGMVDILTNTVASRSGGVSKADREDGRQDEHEYRELLQVQLVEQRYSLGASMPDTECLSN